MELGNARVKTLSQAEESLCIREGFCFRCQEKKGNELAPVERSEKSGKRLPFLSPMISKANVQAHKIKQPEITPYASEKLQSTEMKMDIVSPNKE